MKKYETYKDSGVEWIEEIPKTWNVLRLKYASENNPSNVDKKAAEDETPVLLCNYVDVYKNDYITSQISFMEATASEIQIEKFSLRKGYVLATKDSETPDDIANPAYVADDLRNVVCGYHLTLMKPNELMLDGKFLFNLFKSPRMNSFFEINARGVTRFGLPTGAFNDVYIPLPPIQEQTNIANYLGLKASQLNTLISKKEKLIELLQEERTAVINHAVTKGINPNARMRDSGIEWLGKIPEHWEVKKLKYLLNIQSGKGISNEELNPEGKYPVYGGNGILGYTDNFSSKGEDLIIGRVGALCGNVHLIKGSKWISDNALHATTNQYSKFIFFSLKQLDLNRLANKNAQPLITGTMVKDQSIGLPSREEQEAIVGWIMKERSRLDLIILKTQQEIELLKEYKTALISEVVTGKVDVRNERLN